MTPKLAKTSFWEVCPALLWNLLWQTLWSFICALFHHRVLSAVILQPQSFSLICIPLPLPPFFPSILGIEPITWIMLSKYSTTELQIQLCFLFYCFLFLLALRVGFNWAPCFQWLYLVTLFGHPWDPELSALAWLCCVCESPFLWLWFLTVRSGKTENLLMLGKLWRVTDLIELTPWCWGWGLANTTLLFTLLLSPIPFIVLAGSLP